MRTRTSDLFWLCVVFFLASCAAAPPAASNFRQDWLGLFRAVTMSTGARTYYLGSDTHWSYFETNFGDPLIAPIYRKVEVSRMQLPGPFLSGKASHIRSS